MEIVLNDTEQRLAKYLAKKRFEHNRKSHTTNARIGPQSDEETDLEGIGAEIAYCKLMNVFPDTNIDERPANDCILKNGKTVDVKTTKYKNGHLIAVCKKAKMEEQPDIYALMVGVFPKYRFAGMMDSKELLKEERLKDLGYGPTFAAKQQELHT